MDKVVFGDYSLQIINGKHVETTHGDFVEMMDGQPYKLGLVNSSPFDCSISVRIDGANQGWAISIFHITFIYKFIYVGFGYYARKLEWKWKGPPRS